MGFSHFKYIIGRIGSGWTTTLRNTYTYSTVVLRIFFNSLNCQWGLGLSEKTFVPTRTVPQASRLSLHLGLREVRPTLITCSGFPVCLLHLGREEVWPTLTTCSVFPVFLLHLGLWEVWPTLTNCSGFPVFLLHLGLWEVWPTLITCPGLPVFLLHLGLREFDPL